MSSDERGIQPLGNSARDSGGTTALIRRGIALARQDGKKVLHFPSSPPWGDRVQVVFGPEDWAMFWKLYTDPTELLERKEILPEEFEKWSKVSWHKSIRRIAAQGDIIVPRIYQVSLHISHAADLDLIPTNTLQNVTGLLANNMVDKDAKYLRRVSSLACLNVSRNPVSDEFMHTILPVMNLKYLAIGNTRVTDSGVLCLRGMSKLDFLDLSDTRISGRGLRALEDAIMLHRIDLTRTQIEDDGLAELPLLPSLSSIFLSSTRISSFR